MPRQELLGKLLRVRELRLKAEAADLRARVQALSRVEATLEQARSAAAESIEMPRHLHELGALGELRLAYRRMADVMGKEVDEKGQSVARARKLADVARDACKQIERDKTAERERRAETEAEHFFGWKKSVQE
jgi:hypothetical protein